MNKLLLAAGLGLAALSPAFADDLTAGDLTLSDPWVRVTTSVARSSGAFVAITNTGATDDRLLSAQSDFARVEIHRTETTDGVNRMVEQVEGIALPAGESVALMPGGYHIMLMGLESGIAMGETREVTLVFENAGPLVVEFVGRLRAAGGHGADHEGHGQEGHGAGGHGHGGHDH